MTLSSIVDTYLYILSRAGNLWLSQGQRRASLQSTSIHSRINPTRILHIRRPLGGKVAYLKQSQCTKNNIFSRGSYLRSKFGLYSNISQFSTSLSRGSTSLSHCMSRIKNTLDSVSKAVSSTHTERLLKIVRLKPSASAARKEIEPIVQFKCEDSDKPASVAADPKPNKLEDEKKPLEKSILAHGNSASTISTANNKLDQKTSRDSSAAKGTKPDLFHPSYFTTNFGETYNFVATHVNVYFGGKTDMDQVKPDKDDTIKSPNSAVSSESTPAAAVPTSPKKGIAHVLSYSTNSVQAFMGSYLGTLVPRFRSEPQSIAEAKHTLQSAVEETAKKEETVNVKEPKTSDDKAKRLSLQREKIIARVSVDNRTRALVQALQRASDVKVYINRVEELSYHLLEFPETKGVAVKEKVIPCLLRLRQASDETLQAAVREALSLVGYIDPVKGRGIRVLSIDGGGTRGLVALQTLHKLEELTGKPIYQLFDYICGVSTGAILGFMLGLFQIPLAECEDLYRRLGSDVFKQNVIVGTVKMGWSHAFYDSEIWETILKERIGSDLMIETARNAKCPKVAAVSTIVNRGTPLKAYVFRNYNLPPGVKSHYLGGCHHKLWQALRASSAAPGYFQEFVLGNDLHQDGGLLINNPAALAIHECKCLWPDTPVQCLVSLGTGRYESEGKNNATYTSLKTKLTNVISSATDTEEVHTMLDALLPPNTYFRFNPHLNEDIQLNENRKEKLNLLQTEGTRYLERNEEKLKKAAEILLQDKTTFQRVKDWIKCKTDMYDGLPRLSKL
ncbi:calcium-independent phospholipase A2-gamma isoform X2 [Acipenser ruthenus]|uniref:calcium-independent phospholipase A2-gamma isoform X2 n=1 Tax=Acipenser ruthenus TaxID=7906 RepID=UPI00155F8718|nr:calcium-independent phospholipase A2-gamma isoform X2 [Acipenser ruthenus]